MDAAVKALLKVPAPKLTGAEIIGKAVKTGAVRLPRRPPMRYVTTLAVFVRVMDALQGQHLPCMAPQAVAIARFNSCMGFVAFVAVQTGHGHPLRK